MGPKFFSNTFFWMGKMTWVFFFTQYWITLTFKFPLRCQFHWHNPFHHNPFILSVGPMVISPLSLLTLIICLCLFLISLVNVYQFLKKILFTFRVRRRKRQRQRETSMCGCLSCAPYWEPGPQPRHVLWLGIEPVTFWFAGRHSIHWATPARAEVYQFY